MCKYYLKTKSGEVVTTTKQDGYVEAISFFSKRKNINENDLLKIYKIVEG
jgi:hypothetical protein